MFPLLLSLAFANPDATPTDVEAPTEETVEASADAELLAEPSEPAGPPTPQDLAPWQR